MKIPGVPVLLALACTACAPAQSLRARAGFLGVTEDSQEEPVTLASVLPGSAAEAAGLERGDVIHEVDGKPLASYEPLREAVKASPDRPLKLRVLRRGADLTLTVTPRGRACDPEEVQRAFGELMETVRKAHPEAQRLCEAFAKTHPGTDAGAASAAYAIQFSASTMSAEEVLRRVGAWAEALPSEPALDRDEFLSLGQAYAAAGGKDPKPWIDCLERIAASAREPNLAAAAHFHAAASEYAQGQAQAALEHAEAALRDAPWSGSAQDAADLCYEIRHLGVGMAAPGLRAPTLDGKEADLSAMKGRPVLLCFWASWCGPCKREAPAVRTAAERFSAKGLQVLGVCLDDKGAKDKALAFVAEHRQAFPQAFDGQAFSSPAAKAYNVQGIPALFLVDAEGRIAAKGIRGEGVAKAIEALLGN